MQTPSLQYLFLLPIGLGLAFMFWVLWNLSRQLAYRDDSTEKQLIISIRVGERYSLGRQMQRSPRSEFEVPSPRVSDSGAKPSRSLSPEYFQTPGVPTLGMGLRQKSSSTIQGAHR
jgi:hypothetical protein